MRPNFKILLSLYILCVLATSSFWFYFHKTELQLFPQQNNFEISPYSDINEGGSSISKILQQDSVLNIEVELHSGTARPFAGVIFPLFETEDAFARTKNFSDFDSVYITFRSRIKNLSLILFTKDPKITKVNDISSFRPLYISTEAEHFYKEAALPLSKLQTPLIWFDTHGIKEDENLYLNEVNFIGIESGKGTLLGMPTEIEIKEIRFVGRKPIVNFASLFVLLILTVTFIFRLRRG